MSDNFDVIVVGARCAGAPLAALLAREGVSVALVEQARFPKDTLSTHAFQADAIAFLDRLGVIERLRAAQAPLVNRADIRLQHTHLLTEWPRRPDDPGGWMSVRRHVLDPVLAQAAAQAGADVRMGAKATRLLAQRGRVAGVAVASDGEELELRARLVVGADGRYSTVARLTGARAYHIEPNQRALYWGYFEGVSPSQEATLLMHRWGERFVLAIPTDGGLFQVLAWPALGERARHNPEQLFAEHVGSCAPLARLLVGAERVGKLRTAARWESYFRQAAGPGWVLVGDAGHFKDPAIGRGIGDAFVQADALAPAICNALRGPHANIDRAMAEWGAWRDRQFIEHHWLAVDFGRAGPLPALLPEVVRRMAENGNAGAALDVLNHRAKPSEVFTPARLLGASGSLVRQRRLHSEDAFELVALLARDTRRRHAPCGTRTRPTGLKVRGSTR